MAFEPAPGMPIGFPSRVLLAAAALALPACASSSNHEPPQQAELARAVAPPERLGGPQWLPGPARQILRTRMVSHASDMGQLMTAIMVLKYSEVRERADAIAGDANLSRPLTGDATELNSLLPERFFQHQDDLRRQARALSAAAARMNAKEVATAYGALSETCVHCHATYRAGR
jgi:cytochrome c556